METVTVIIIAAVVGVISAAFAYFFGSHASDSKVLELKEKLDAKGSRPVKSEKKKTSPKAQAAPKAKDNKKLNELKDTVKKTKSQLHSAKAEIKTLKEAAKSKKNSTKNNGAKQDADLIFKLREEVGELKGALENAKTKATQKRQEKPAERVEKQVETEGLDDASREVISQLETAHRTKLKSLTEKHRKTEKEIRQKMRAASGNVDKQRRRADNNDRAYKITQRQVDALQERISFLEKGPDDKPVALQIATATVAAPAAVATPDVRTTSKLPVNTDTEVRSTQALPTSDVEKVPGGLTAPSEPTTIEMSPDIAESLFNSTDDGAPKIAVSVDSLVASPSSVEEEPSRQTMRLDDIGLTNELEAAPKKDKLSEASAVDDAWAEFDVD